MIRAVCGAFVRASPICLKKRLAWAHGPIVVRLPRPRVPTTDTAPQRMAGGRYRHAPTSRPPSPLPQAVLRLSVWLKKRNGRACSPGTESMGGRPLGRAERVGRAIVPGLERSGNVPRGALFDRIDLSISSKPSFLSPSSPERAHSPQSLSESFCFSSPLCKAYYLKAGRLLSVRIVLLEAPCLKRTP